MSSKLFSIPQLRMSWGMFIGGIGLFIFGMLQFEQAIKQLSGKTIKRMLQHYTNKVRKGVTMGVGMTALAQSSTIVSLIVVGFVGAGLLSLHSAMGVIVGANLGSTFTPWMVALLGFKTNIFSLAFYFVGAGGFGLLLTNEYSKSFPRWKLLFGFGLLFLGIDFLQQSVEQITTQLDTSMFANIGLFMAILIGLGMAFVMQTSAATSVVILSALNAHMIGFELAVSIMIGANLGSAFSTALMGSLSSSGKSRVKKQVMIGHTLFNIFSAVVVVLFLPLIMKFIGIIIPNKDPIISLTVFHTLFNLIGVICLSPLVGIYCRWISRVYPSGKQGTSLAIEQVATNMPEEVLVALDKDLLMLRKKVYVFVQSCFGFNNKEIELSLEDITPDKVGWLMRLVYKISPPKKVQHSTDEQITLYHPDSLAHRLNEYRELKEIEGKLYSYIIRLPKQEFINGTVEKLNHIQDRIYTLLDAAKLIKDDMDHIEHISAMEDEHIATYWMHVCKQIEQEIAFTLGQQASEYSTQLVEEGALYNFLQEQTLMQNREEEGLSNEEIAEILKTSRHALYVINLLKQEKSVR